MSVCFACVCASNVNRSMRSHEVLQQHGFNVCSFGTNEHIRTGFPGKPPMEFDFGTTYQEILEALEKLKDNDTDSNYYDMLWDMMDKDKAVKEKPEQFCDVFNRKEPVDVIFTYQYQGCMEKVISEFRDRGSKMFRLCHVINLETHDDPTTAKKNSQITLKIAEEIRKLDNITEGLEDLLNRLTDEKEWPLSFQIVSY